MVNGTIVPSFMLLLQMQCIKLTPSTKQAVIVIQIPHCCIIYKKKSKKFNAIPAPLPTQKMKRVSARRRCQICSEKNWNIELTVIATFVIHIYVSTIAETVLLRFTACKTRSGLYFRLGLSDFFFLSPDLSAFFVNYIFIKCLLLVFIVHIAFRIR